MFGIFRKICSEIEYKYYSRKHGYGQKPGVLVVAGMSTVQILPVLIEMLRLKNLTSQNLIWGLSFLINWICPQTHGSLTASSSFPARSTCHIFFYTSATRKTMSSFFPNLNDCPVNMKKKIVSVNLMFFRNDFVYREYNFL